VHADGRGDLVALDVPSRRRPLRRRRQIRSRLESHHFGQMVVATLSPNDTVSGDIAVVQATSTSRWRRAFVLRALRRNPGDGGMVRISEDTGVAHLGLAAYGPALYGFNCNGD